jgi:hypothetical protein
MDKFLKLKLDLVYRDLPVEQARQSFSALKEPAPEPEAKQEQAPAPAPKPEVKRRKRIPAKK